jgi:sulfhydrogenase subunit delta
MRKTLAIFSLTSCEGCQFEMLNHFSEFEKLLQLFEVKNFRLGQEENLPGPFDIAIIEGNPEGQKQIDFLRQIRKHSGIIIAIGACAHLGGIQSERNRLPKKLINKTPTKTVPDTIKTDYIIPGCPINHLELYHCLLDIYWGKTFNLPDLSVCFECRKNENECLIKQNKPCLGPITRMGCDSICVNRGEACLGCRGAILQPNVEKLKEVLHPIIGEIETENLLSIYGELK